jgi:hypothetical protein
MGGGKKETMFFFIKRNTITRKINLLIYNQIRKQIKSLRDKQDKLKFSV